jgi:hypothetical protein
MSTLIAVPLFFIGGCVYLVILVAVACTAVTLFRRIRLRFTLLLHRGTVPPDGKPLEDWEIPLFAGIQRNWGQLAPEPEYDTEGER